MKLSEVCIQRPVFAWVMTFILILVGVVGAYRLPLQQYPKIERPYITIETSIPGAGPEIVEAQVTRVIEDAVSGIEGIENITSISSTEESKVTIEFRPERGVDNATNDIRDRLAKSKNKIPEEATEPVLVKSRAEERPIITIALTSETISPSELHDFAQREIEKDLESVAGVARVDVLGAGQYEMNLYLNPIRLAAYGITVSEVITAIKRQSIEKPAGKLISQNREYLVTTVANLEKPEEFENLVVATKNKHLVRLRDIGRAEITSNDKKTRTRYNGKQGISIGVIKQSTANPVEVARNVKEEMEKIQKHLPSEIMMHIGSDKTIFIERSIVEVYKTILEATTLVILVVFLFLRSARASLIPLVTIPVSLIGALFIMYLLNFSINMFTLMAMVLAIGLVVDDAIVILENIYRYMEEGLSALEASIKGVREISFAVIAMTLTLAAVYTPVSLAQGMTGKLLTEFSITLAGAVIVSGFAALTLSPMMCARLLVLNHSHKEDDDKPSKLETKALGLIEKYQSKLETLKENGQTFKVFVLKAGLGGFIIASKLIKNFSTGAWLDKTEEKYEQKLRQILNYRLHVVGIAIGFSVIGYITYRNLPSEFTPREDQGTITIEGQSPQTATLDYTERYVEMIDNILGSIPEIDRRVTQIINPTFDVSLQLKNDRKRSTEEISNDIRKKAEEITGVEAKVSSGSTGISGDDNRAVQFVVRGNKTYRELKDITQNLTANLYASGMILGVTSEIHGDTEDFTVTIIRDKVSSLNIEPATIAETIDALIRGRRANSFKKENKLYDVKVEVENSARRSPDDITNLFVKAGDKDGTLVPLSELVKVHSRAGPVEVHHHNRMRAVTMNAFLKPGFSLGEAINKVAEIAVDAIPSDARLDYIGDTKRYLSENKTMLLIFGLAICFIYLVMAAQFESWRDPFIILLSVPLSLAGAVLTLGVIDGGSLNLYSNIGLITLIGLITKHGILMVDFSNKLRGDGKEIFASIIEASKLRLRPILMTTFAMVLGALPLAFSTGAGSESRRQLGWVIVGGMSIGTIFTLFVIPVFYTYLSARKRKSLLSIETTA
ncbi:MAG: efflux RND transporter permease subunit [Alphaproteobacteria bacterium]|nr:efflux RND transporter permease subunit [Alphaproteobacteria bacterium]